MADPKDVNEFKAFKKFYVQLTEVLPISDLVDGLFANNLLPGDHKAQVKVLRTQKEKSRYLLDEVIEPGLRVGIIEQFSKMIDIMESCDDHVAIKLAKQMKDYLLGALSGNKWCVYICICVWKYIPMYVCFI